MNEQIRAIMEQVVRIDIDPDSECETIYTCNPDDFEVFAELIIQKCLRLCDEVDLAGADDCIQNIKDYFEIEQ